MSDLITREELRRKLERGERFVLAEALPESYFHEGHLPGAIQISHEALDVAKLGARDSEVVIYCANSACKNSHLAAERLEALGYARVKVYAGGKQDWSSAGLPLVRS